MNDIAACPASNRPKNTADQMLDRDTVTDPQSQLLTFTLAEAVYGVAILKVQEIRGVGAITPLPGTPPFLSGIINLRGAVVPVIDLRVRLGLPAARPGRFAVTIIVRSGEKSVGLLTDAVNDVVTVAPAEFSLPPGAAQTGESRFIERLALPRTQVAGSQTETDLIMVLDPEQIYNAPQFEEARHEATPQ
jgi:purine-binding chemotaxis protein CheW